MRDKNSMNLFFSGEKDRNVACKEEKTNETRKQRIFKTIQTNTETVKQPIIETWKQRQTKWINVTTNFPRMIRNRKVKERNLSSVRKLECALVKGRTEKKTSVAILRAADLVKLYIPHKKKEGFAIRTDVCVCCLWWEWKTN